MKKCLYCKCDIDDNSVIDFCKKCGVHMFGEKTLGAIIENMEAARDKGDLYQGFVGENKEDKKITFETQSDKNSVGL